MSDDWRGLAVGSVIRIAGVADTIAIDRMTIHLPTAYSVLDGMSPEWAFIEGRMLTDEEPAVTLKLGVDANGAPVWQRYQWQREGLSTVPVEYAVAIAEGQVKPRSLHVQTVIQVPLF
jgi:hypothetical protein